MYNSVEFWRQFVVSPKCIYTIICVQQLESMYRETIGISSIQEKLHLHKLKHVKY